MTDYLLTGAALERLQREVRLFGSQKALAEKAGISATTLSQIVSKGGDVSVSRLGKISAALGRDIDYFFSEDRQHQSPRCDMSLMTINQIDATYGLGGTFYDGAPVETAMRFPTEWVRNYTRASAENLYFAHGVGDSMQPTIQDSDLLLIDRAQNHLNMGDKIWAIAYGDVGMIKRLRPTSGQTVTVLSDNPSVPPFEAADGEMTILGRVVAIVRKM